MFVTSPGRSVQVRVDVYDESSCSGAACTGLLASVILNGNPGADVLKDPDCTGKSCRRDGQSVVAYEGHNPDLVADAYSVAFPSYRNPSLRNPSLRNSVYESPSLRNQTVEFPSLRNPSLRNSPLDDSSAAQFQTYTDFVYDVANTGNTTSGYTLKPLITGPLTGPDGKPLSPELIVSACLPGADRPELRDRHHRPAAGDRRHRRPGRRRRAGRRRQSLHIERAVRSARRPGPLGRPPARHVRNRAGRPGAGHAQGVGIDAVQEHPEFRNRVWMKVYVQAANTGGGNGSRTRRPSTSPAAPAPAPGPAPTRTSRLRCSARARTRISC